MHQLYHVLDQIEAKKINLSCFATERKHKEIKAVATHLINDAAGQAMLVRRILGHFFTFFEDDTFLMPEYCATGLQRLTTPPAVLALYPGAAPTAMKCSSVRSVIGNLTAGDVLAVVHNGRMYVGRAACFYRVIVSGSHMFAVELSVLSPRGNGLYADSGSRSVFKLASALSAVPWVKTQGAIHPCLPVR